jgi:hypothetical protein
VKKASAVGNHTVYWISFHESQFDADGDGYCSGRQIWKSAQIADGQAKLAQQDFNGNRDKCDRDAAMPPISPCEASLACRYPPHSTPIRIPQSVPQSCLVPHPYQNRSKNCANFASLHYSSALTLSARIAWLQWGLCFVRFSAATDKSEKEKQERSDPGPHPRKLQAKSWKEGERHSPSAQGRSFVAGVDLNYAPALKFQFLIYYCICARAFPKIPKSAVTGQCTAG